MQTIGILTSTSSRLQITLILDYVATQLFAVATQLLAVAAEQYLAVAA